MSSSLPPALDFSAAEEEICAQWAEEETFKNQDKLSLERGDEVSYIGHVIAWSVLARRAQTYASFYQFSRNTRSMTGRLLPLVCPIMGIS